VISPKYRILIMLVCLVALACAGATRALSDQGSGAAGSEPAPVEYQPPAGPELTTEQVAKIAHAQAQENGDPSPTAVTQVSGTLGRALEVMAPEVGVPSGPGGMAEMDSHAMLLVMHGDFTLNAARVPRGHAAPAGSVLSVVIDAHTGLVEGRALSDEAPRAGELGEVTSVG
jgi:hypothetical protein